MKFQTILFFIVAWLINANVFAEKKFCNFDSDCIFYPYNQTALIGVLSSNRIENQRVHYGELEPGKYRCHVIQKHSDVETVLRVHYYTTYCCGFFSNFALKQGDIFERDVDLLVENTCLNPYFSYIEFSVTKVLKWWSFSNEKIDVDNTQLTVNCKKLG